jgi:signal transduction histidine kinase
MKKNIGENYLNISLLTLAFLVPYAFLIELDSEVFSKTSLKLFKTPKLKLNNKTALMENCCKNLKKLFNLIFKNPFKIFRRESINRLFRKLLIHSFFILAFYTKIESKNLNTVFKNKLYSIDTIASNSYNSDKKIKSSNKYFTKKTKLIKNNKTLDKSNWFSRKNYKQNIQFKEQNLLQQEKKELLTIGFIIFLSAIIYFTIDKKYSEKEKIILQNSYQEKLEEEKLKERIRISEYLHDFVLGKLFAIRLELGFIDIRGDKIITKKYHNFLGELHKIEKEIRELSHELNNNLDVSLIDFDSTIKQLLRNKSTLGNFKYQITIDETLKWQAINKVIKINFYYILQEVLQNVLKYASAKNVSMHCSQECNQLILMINDDGKGFDIKKNKKGIGLKNIKSRVEKLNGNFKLNATIKKGTKIRIQIPL